jgi:hypothetical protein
MSEENMEIARRLYPDQPIDLVSVFSDSALLGVMRSQVEPLVHPDVESVGDSSQVGMAWESREAGGKGRPSRPIAVGIEGFLTVWRDWLTAWESWVVKPAEFIDVDEDRVLVLLDVQGRSKTHQVDIPLPSANLLTLREGRVARLELFTTQAEAREAAGLAGEDSR